MPYYDLLGEIADRLSPDPKAPSGNGAGGATQDTKLNIGTTLTLPEGNANTRPVAQEIWNSVQPLAAPGVLTDFHGLDLQITIPLSGANVNSNSSMYGLESKASHFGSQTINRLHGILGESVVASGGGTAAEIYGVKAFNQVLNSSHVTTRSASFWAAGPVVDGTSSVAVAAGLYVQGFSIASNPQVTTPLAIFVSDGESRFSDSVVCTGGGTLANAATDGYLYIPQMAGAPTGTPRNRPSSNAIVYDTTNNKLWIYNGAWRGVVVA